MTTITLTISNELNDFINEQIKKGVFSNKTELVIHAIQKIKDGFFVQEILQAKQEIKGGKLVKGDLDKITKLFK